MAVLTNTDEYLPIRNCEMETTSAGRKQTDTKHRPTNQQLKASDLPRLLLCNAQSMGNKVEDMNRLLLNQKIDIACVTETWVSCAEVISIDGYECFLVPRPGRDGQPVDQGGGVAFYCRNDLRSRILSPPVAKDDQIEVSWLWLRPKLLPKTVSSVIVGLVYYPPRGPFRKRLMEYLQLSTDYLRSKYPYAGLIVCGDFNDLSQKWISESLSLRQVVKIPTRKDKVLDLIFTSMETLYSEPRVLAPLGKSDHNCVVWLPKASYPKEPKRKISFRCYKPESIQLFKKDLCELDWRHLYYSDSANAMTEFFCSMLSELHDQHFPEKTKLIKPNEKPWVTPEIKEMIAERDRIFAYCGNNAEYKTFRNRVANAVKKARKKYGSKITAKLLTTEPRKFHKIVQSLLGKEKKKVEVCDEKGNKLSADTINEHFASICRKYPPLDSLPPLPPVSEIPVIEEHMVFKELQKINPRKSAYPNELPPHVIRECALELCTPLTAVLNQSASEGIFPEVLKRAVVTPIPKKSQPNGLKDLRPISQTSAFAKIFEAFILRWLLADIGNNLDDRQFGFRPGYSTVHYLVRLLDTILRHLELPGSFIDCLIADFVKAFDYLCHYLVVREAEIMGARKIVLRLVASYLSQRVQCVKLENGEVSDFLPITCGAPQGGKLGPSCFTIVINSLIIKITERLKFADDLTLPILRSINDVPDKCPVREAFDTLCNEAEKLKLTVSSEKSTLIRFSFLKQKTPPPDQVLGSSKTVKILGLHLDDNLSMEMHVSKIVSKTSNLMKIFAKLRRFAIPKEAMLTTYVTYIRPVTEYACPVWHPMLSQDQSSRLESLQKRACKIILGQTYVSYEDSTKQLRISTLSERRHHLTMSFGKRCLRSEVHRDILPASASTPSGNTRRAEKLKRCDPLLQKPPIKHSQRYSRSFVPYFVKHHNLEAESKQDHDNSG